MSDVCHAFLNVLCSYKTVSPSGKASQKEFLKSKISEDGDMFDIYESFMRTKAENYPSATDNVTKTCTAGNCKHFWVAINSDNKVLGCVGIIMSTYPLSVREIYEDADQDTDTDTDIEALSPQNVCELVRMSVSEEARGKGLGSRLCNVLESYAMERGMKRIVLSTLEDMHLAVGLYVKCGYRLLTKTNVDINFFKHVAEQDNFEIEEVVVVHYGKDIS